ncbi:cobalamin biosynthesis protein [Natrialbaceae archaeon AArc-T1-2]|uniref:cobalamin biosynthesis protein n=1 Tax=Natrialbaceae archaeon AArc-T1-2 TaxID=3053904 RepID=UPI00255AD51E|nr:cobalamin biosynthesis protein [Natrialbaceae archaeon AArc-T1-2]WIV66471.1 cobalamin biosynthesis protein [Natrialbaceae archaeon AArc-T1-2]
MTDGTLEIERPADLLAGHPATAYLWGHVAGSGEVTADGLEVVANDEPSAEVLAAIAGGAAADPERETTTREYAHDTSITRTDEEYTVAIDGSELYGQSGPLGLPVDGRGNYRFSAFSAHKRELLRGLLEGCGTVCFKSSSGTVGISFVADDRELLEAIDDLLASCPVEAPTGEISETSSGGYWFGLADDAAPAFGEWCYETCEETGLYAPSRKRKLERSLEQAENV